MKTKQIACWLLTNTWTAVLAQAQQPAASSGSAAQEPPQLEEIVVTAQKRAGTAQETPAAIVALSGDQLTSRGVTDLSQLGSLVPSGQFQPVRSQVQVFIRGVGQNNTGPNADPAVATNLNGIYQLSDMTGAAFFDLDRIEILPGPQGTLYGRNAAGGTVNLISRRPGYTFGGNAAIEIGAYNLLNVDLGVDVPVSDAFSLRAAARVDRHDGYLSNGGDDDDSKAVRLTGVYKLSDSASLVVVGSYTRRDGIGDQVVNLPPVKSSDPWYYPFDARGAGLFEQDDFRTASAEFNAELSDHVKLTYVGGFDDFERSQLLILDGRPVPLAVQTQDIRQNGKFQSHELRLSGEAASLQWLGGAYYYNSNQDYDNHVVLPPVTDVIQGPIVVNGHGLAAFGQFTWSLMSRLRLTGGARYSHDAKDGGGPYTVTVAGTPHPSPFAGSMESDHADWKVGLEGDLARDSLLYANVQTGYNQGGFSFAPPIGGNPNTYQPEKLTAYTVGSKNRLLDRSLQLNAEGYYYDYKNYQVSARDLRTSLNIIYNAQATEIYGAQIDATYLLTTQDKLTASAGLLHAIATRLVLPSSVSGQANFSGYELPFAPKETLNASYEHDFPLPNGAALQAAASSSFVGRRWGAYNHPVGTNLPSFHRSDASLAYVAASGKWSLQIYGRNLENAAVFDSVVASSLPGPAAGFLEPPRTYGVRLATNF